MPRTVENETETCLASEMVFGKKRTTEHRIRMLMLLPRAAYGHHNIHPHAQIHAHTYDFVWLSTFTQFREHYVFATVVRNSNLSTHNYPFGINKIVYVQPILVKTLEFNSSGKYQNL